jgi:hypothetical protein
MPAAQANVIPAGKVPFSIEITVDNTAVTGQLASEIAVTIPVSAPPASGKKFIVYYVAADGVKTPHDAVYSNGKLTFTTDKI